MTRKHTYKQLPGKPDCPVKSNGSVMGDDGDNKVWYDATDGTNRHFEYRVKSGTWWEEVEAIVLHDVQGIARKSGTDEHGNEWVEFEVDAFAEQEPGECSICGETLHDGWMCLDGGEEVCSSHVEYTDTDVANAMESMRKHGPKGTAYDGGSRP